MPNEDGIADHVLEQVGHTGQHVVRLGLHRAVVDDEDGPHDRNICWQRGSWIVDRTQLRKSAFLAHNGPPRTPKVVRPCVAISLARTTDSFNPCWYPLNPYSPSSVERPERPLLVASGADAP